MKALPDRYDVRVRLIDVKSWNSDVAKHFGIRSLPTVWLYEGRELSSTNLREILPRYFE